MDDNLLKKMFERVKDPAFKSWEIVDTISENDFINNANSGTNSGTTNNFGTNPPPQPNTGQQQQQQQSSNPPPPPPGNGYNMGGFINENLAVELVDIIGSAGGMIAVKAITKKRVSRTKFKATNEEKELLKQPMKAALAQMQMLITNPAEALFWGILIVYGSKVGIEIVEEKFTKEETIDTDFEEIKPKRGRPKKS